MRSKFGLSTFAPALVLGLAFAAQAPATSLQIDNDHCGFTSNYDLRVNTAGIAFDSDSNQPASVFMHDGKLRVNGRELAVSADDAERLRQYEGQVRVLLPEVAGVAREGMDIGFSALTTVAATFAASADERERIVKQLNSKHAASLQQLDSTIGSGVLKQHGMSQVIEDSVESAVAELVSTVAAGAVKAALSGDQSQVAALQARADSLEKSIDKEVNARADKLKLHAQALCPRIEALQQLQDQFQFRLSDGSRLLLIKREPTDGKRGSQTKDASVTVL